MCACKYVCVCVHMRACVCVCVCVRVSVRMVTGARVYVCTLELFMFQALSVSPFCSTSNDDKIIIPSLIHSVTSKTENLKWLECIAATKEEASVFASHFHRLPFQIV